MARRTDLTGPLCRRDIANGIAGSLRGAIDDFKGLAAVFCTAAVHTKSAVTTITPARQD